MDDNLKKLFEIEPKNIPKSIPIFPLDNVLLLPFGKLPLNIFEERYIKMTLDSLKTNRMIGIIQPKNNNNELFQMGCIGKITSYTEYRVTNRGGKGIIGIINSPRNGDIASTLVVSETDEILLSTDKGSIMRCAVKEIRIAGRNTQGVRIKKLTGAEKVVSVIKIEDNIQ